MNDPGLLDSQQLNQLLRELDHELSAMGIKAEMYVVGGTAMALAYDQRRVTRDIDAIFKPADLVYEAAARIAARYGLDEDWLNDEVSTWVPAEYDQSALTYYEGSALSVGIASPEFLLAMKLKAARSERDWDDILKLCETLDVTTKAQLLQAVEAAYGMPSLSNESMILLEEVVAYRKSRPLA